jgi:excisionase family DNA binding protein
LLDLLKSMVDRFERLEHLLTDLQYAVDQGGTITEWLTTGEFAAEVGRAEFTVRTWCNHGRLRAEKTGNGRHWRIHRDELHRYRRNGLLPYKG